MILNHLWGIYAHPREEWKHIDENHESFGYALSHIALIALIPSCVCYYASAHLGWSIGAGDTIKLTQGTAVVFSVSMYFGLIGGVVALAVLMHQLANAFDVYPNFTQALELAAYTATPLFMVGLAGLYPSLWFVMMVGLVGLSYSVYLLYSGVPIMLHIPEEKGFIYSSSVVTCGLVLLVILMAGSVVIWGTLGGPVFTS